MNWSISPLKTSAIAVVSTPHRFYTSHFGKEQRHIRGLSGYRQLQFYRVVFRQLLERLERVADSSKYLRHQPQDYWLDIRGFSRKRETTVLVFPKARFLG